MPAIKFARPEELPEGFLYRDELLTEAEESELLRIFRSRRPPCPPALAKISILPLVARTVLSANRAARSHVSQKCRRWGTRETWGTQRGFVR
jgi:hypothetical protein